MSARMGPLSKRGEAGFGEGTSAAVASSSVGSDGGGKASGDNGKKRSRVSRACDACYARKDRCDGGQPLCKVCRDLDRRCTYDRPERKRGPLQGVRQRLEAQIEILESVLGYMVDSFPHLSHDALRPLVLDDGAEVPDVTPGGHPYNNKTDDPDGLNHDTGSSSAASMAVAGPSRLPKGNIYPHYAKSYAKEIWRHSDFARSIAPSLGLRLGFNDEEEDVIDLEVQRQRVEEARRARARIMMSAGAPTPRFFVSPSASSAAPASLTSVAPSSSLMYGTQSPFQPSSSALAGEMQTGGASSSTMMSASASNVARAMGAAVATAHPQSSLSLPPELGGVEMDPFAVQWSHAPTFDLGHLGEGGHALAYALGLPTAADGGGEHGHSGGGFHAHGGEVQSSSPIEPRYSQIDGSSGPSGSGPGALAPIQSSSHPMLAALGDTSHATPPPPVPLRSSVASSSNDADAASLADFQDYDGHLRHLSQSQQQQQQHHPHQHQHPHHSPYHPYHHHHPNHSDQASSILYQLGLQDSL